MNNWYKKIFEFYKLIIGEVFKDPQQAKHDYYFIAWKEKAWLDINTSNILIKL